MRPHRFDITIYRPNGEMQAIHTAYGHRAVEQFRQIAKDVYPAGTRLEIVDLTRTPSLDATPEIDGLVSLPLSDTLSVQLDTQQRTLLVASATEQHLVAPDATIALCALFCRYASTLEQSNPTQKEGPYHG